MDYCECPPARSYGLCSDDECPCNNTAIPPAKGYLYISQRVVDTRKDCLSRSEVEAKYAAMQKSMGAQGAVMFVAKDLFFPVVVCEVGARKRNLDLNVASADYDRWERTGKVPCRVTPTAPLTK